MKTNGEFRPTWNKTKQNQKKIEECMMEFWLLF